MDPVLTDDDKPAPPQPRRVSAGLLWAAVLATLVLAIAVVVSFSFKADSDVTKITLDGEKSPLEGGETTQDLVGEQVPALFFAVYDPDTKTFGTGGGSLADYRSAPMVINFWASTCAPCVSEMPALEQVANEYDDRVVFLGINPKTDPNDAAVDMIDTTGVTYTLGRDDNASMLNWFGIVGLPTTLFIDATGTISYVHTGPLDAAGIEEILTNQVGV